MLFEMCLWLAWETMSVANHEGHQRVSEVRLLPELEARETSEELFCEANEIEPSLRSMRR